MTESTASTRAELRRNAARLSQSLRSRATAPQRRQASTLLLELRNEREWASLRGLAEALLRVEPEQFDARRLYAQALIEDGELMPAIGLLAPMAANLPVSHAEYGEAWGLLGRAHKQQFADLAGAAASLRHQALADAIAAYEVPYRADPIRHTWHGVNLVAMVARARREGWNDIGTGWDVATLAASIAGTLYAGPADDWTLATLAEVALAFSLSTGDLQVVTKTLKDYLSAKGTRAFHVGSTLRQFTEIWQLEQINRRTKGIGLRSEDQFRQAHNLVDMLRARLLGLPDGRVEMPVAQRAPSEAPSKVELEAVLGKDGPRTYAWWRAGVDAANSVAVIRRRLGQRIGTGFLVRAGDLGLAGDPAEALLLTNFHVINPTGAEDALRPEEAEVVFEARDPTLAHAVDKVLWCSPVTAHDACLLRLAGTPADVKPLAVSKELPALPTVATARKPRVYVIGYPGGRELAVSMDDNELIGHEGPPGGKPKDPSVWRVHYRAPTEGGSSGSPVFEEKAWQVIALHHAGGKFGVKPLNGATVPYAANEGLAIGPLAKAAAAALNAASAPPG